MLIECTCGKWHEVTPTGMGIIIDAYRSGDLQSIKLIKGLVTIRGRCVTTAFTEERITLFRQRYGNKSVIRIDGHTFASMPEDPVQLATTTEVLASWTNGTLTNE